MNSSGIYRPTEYGRKFAYTLFTVWFLVKRSTFKMLYTQLMSWDVQFLGRTSPSNPVTHFSDDNTRFLKRARVTQRLAELKVLPNAHWIYTRQILRHAVQQTYVQVRLALVQRPSRRHPDGWSTGCVRQSVIPRYCERRTPMDYTDTSQWTWRNCSC
jgi:hypothetical protein